VNAENPASGFTPQAGTVTGYLAPGGPGIRVDSHLYPGYAVPPNYDSLIGKIIAWGATRDEAIARMRRALSETVVSGVETTIPFYQYVLGHQAFASGNVHTGVIGTIVDEIEATSLPAQDLGLAHAAV
jgi:acetyl-CoA carboxylase biotin carboxylase subunit